MNNITQNSAQLSQEYYLVPAPDLLDGRTEQDTLNFLTRFATLINFYDKDNHRYGDWSPFLLKDPVFLLASISKTAFNKSHLIYRNTCIGVENAIHETDTQDQGITFSLLFDELENVFMQVGQWAWYMENTGEEYELHRYIVGQLIDKFSAVYWALCSLREQMFLLQLVKDIKQSRYEQPPWMKSTTWTTNKDKLPCWDVLGLKYPLGENTLSDFLNAIVKSGDELYVFFQTITQRANSEYETAKRKRSRFPDTTLLRTFTNLLEIYRKELNGITEKHLQFYYKDILKQEQRPAQPDSVFVSATLAQPLSVFYLPAGTQLDAGFDEQKKTIVFETRQSAVLNTAVISKANTLYTLTGADNRQVFYLDSISNLSTINKSETGEVLSWKTFGGSEKADKPKLAIAFASPMFYLREGERKIIIRLVVEDFTDPELLDKTAFFFSTAADWLKIQPVKKGIREWGELFELALEFEIKQDQPALEAFVQNPDGYVNQWPLFKMEFESLKTPAYAPPIKEMNIEVAVSNLQSCQLYNDFGALDPKAPFPLFGPTPVVNNGFIVGSAEVFSKPVTAFNIDLEWDVLPRNFRKYYEEYNYYLLHNPGERKDGDEIPPDPEKEAAEEKKKEKALKRFFRWLGKILLAIIIWKINKDKKDDPVPTPIIIDWEYINSAFTIEFKELNNRDWEKIEMKQKTKCEINPEGHMHCSPYVIKSGCPLPKHKLGETLFTLDEKCEPLSYSRFAYIRPRFTEKYIGADASLQLTPLQFTDASTNGFIRMNLTGPEFGFGTPIYGNVVTYLALQNAKILAEMIKDPEKEKKFLPVANIPFVPKVKTFTASYTATHTYRFDYGQQEYPVQCYTYTPFKTYMVYDNTMDNEQYSDHINIGMSSERKAPVGVPMFVPFEYSGVLFLEVENLVSDHPLNIYVELAPKYGVVPTTAPKWFYLGKDGWHVMQVLTDGTNGFSCPGIVKVNVPATITHKPLVMPDGKYWISAAVTNPVDAYAETFFMTTNGIMAIRTGTDFLTEATTPVINSSTIQKPLYAIPEILEFVQPFPSFGGRGAENATDMNVRVSKRLKTKDRAVTRSDYFSIIRQEFPEIFYSKTSYDALTNTINTYLVPLYQNRLEPNAFTPVLSACSIGKIKKYLEEKAADFAGQQPGNFDFLYVQVHLSVTISTGYEAYGIKQKIIDALNVFMSPWIKANSPQLAIDTGITSAQVQAFVRTLQGVRDVTRVSFSSYTKDSKGKKTPVKSDPQKVKPQEVNVLIVPDINPQIEINPAA